MKKKEKQNKIRKIILEINHNDLYETESGLNRERMRSNLNNMLIHSILGRSISFPLAPPTRQKYLLISFYIFQHILGKFFLWH